MAYNFNGTSQYLQTSTAPYTGTPVTIACWVRMLSVPSMQSVLVSLGVSSATHRNQIGIGSGTGVMTARAASVGSATGGTLVDSTTSFPLSTWVHIAGVFPTSSSRTVFLNAGSSTTGTVNAGTQNTANSVTIGARWNTTLGLFSNGQIAEVGIWSTDLTSAEIASLADGMTCEKVRPQNLVFYAPLVRDLQDVRGGLTITNNNTATVATHPRVYA